MESTQTETASAIMSSPVRTITSTETIEAAQRLLLRYGHSGLCVVETSVVESGVVESSESNQNKLVGIISRRDIETSLRHGLGHSAVSNLMSRNLRSAEPSTSIDRVRQIMLTYDVGRIPILDSDRLVGIITRTDLIRHKNCHPMSVRALSDAPPAEGILCQRLATYLSETWPILMQLADIAVQRGWSLYVVGGVVRDLLLDLSAQKAETRKTESQKLGGGYAAKSALEGINLKDIDLVVEGEGEGVGVALAEAIRAQHPQVSLSVYGQFQTASLTFQTVRGESLIIDIATARTEFYPYPAANPDVEASSIHQDLYRRDLTINAMAICLSGSHVSKNSRYRRGQLIDFFGGWLDLQKRQLRALHTNSFIEDPTRIFRAVRFAARLDFDLEQETVRLIQYAVSSGVYDSVRSHKKKVPALQNRLTTELKYLLSEPSWEGALVKAAQLDALSCIHRDIKFTPALWRQLRRMNRWLNQLQSETFTNKFGIKALANLPPKWLMLLELILAQLSPPFRSQVSKTLGLNAASQRRLNNLHLWESALDEQMPTVRRPSQLFSLLCSYERCELLLIGDRHPHTLGPKIWRYIVHLSNKPPLITGQNLKQMGYKPSPQFRRILTEISYLTLDGDLTSTQAAEAYVLAHYPQSS